MWCKVVYFHPWSMVARGTRSTLQQSEIYTTVVAVTVKRAKAVQYALFNVTFKMRSSSSYVATHFTPS